MRGAFQVHQLSPNVNPLDTTKRQVTYSTGQLSDSCLRTSYDFPQIPEHRSPTKYARVSSCSHWDVAMLFCSSFTQSERFLQTYPLITRLQVVVMTSFIRMLMRKRVRERVQVRCSDLVGSDLPQRESQLRSGAFLERSSFVPWPFRSFSPEEFPMASCKEDPVSDGGRCLLAHSCCRGPVLFGFGPQAG